MAIQQLFTTGPLDPDGTPQVSPEPHTLLLDDFGSQAITINWNVATSGGTTPSAAGGNATFPVGTTASATSYAATKAGFRLQAGTFLIPAFIVQLETTAALTNNTRWWGYGSNAATPIATAPITNGAVFMLDAADGLLKAAIYSAGTRTFVATLTKPTDGLQHRYEIRYRQSRVYWTIDGNQTVGSGYYATTTFPNIAIATGLFGIIGNANGSTAPASAPTFSVSSFTLADLGANNHSIGDGVRPWLQLTIKDPSTAVAATDNPAAVGLHPSSPLPAGTNALGSVSVTGTTAVSLATNTPTLAAGTSLVGAVGVQATTALASYYTSATTNAATVAKTSAGYVQALVISNGSASAQWVKVYNATSVTLGTTAAVLDIQVAAGATFSLATGPNGVRMTTGIAYAVTGATGATNNTAGAGNVLVALTYV